MLLAIRADGLAYAKAAVSSALPVRTFHFFPENWMRQSHISPLLKK
jgi:hypothetical protein